MVETIILIVLAAAAFAGLRHGLIKQAGSLAAIVLGVTACRLFGRQAAQAVGVLLPQSMAATQVATILGCLALFIVVGIGVGIASRFVSTISHALMLGPLDRAGGALLTLAEAAIALSILLNLWLAVWHPGDAARYRKSPLVSAVLAVSPAVLGHGEAPAQAPTEDPDAKLPTDHNSYPTE